MLFFGKSPLSLFASVKNVLLCCSTLTASPQRFDALSRRGERREPQTFPVSSCRQGLVELASPIVLQPPTSSAVWISTFARQSAMDLPSRLFGKFHFKGAGDIAFGIVRQT